VTVNTWPGRVVEQGVKTRTIAAVLVALLALTSGSPGAWGQPWPEAAAGEAPDLDRTPPRLAYIHGQVSFWRPGAVDWGPAQVNTPLAPGDRLYAAPGSALELQVGARAFVRAGGGQGGAEIGLDRLEPDYLQLEVTSGTTSLDIRELPAGHTVDVNTPDGVLTIERAGYYRIEAGLDRTAFVTYRGGQARLTLEDGARWSVGQNEQVVISGGAEARVELAAATGLTEWDRWNHERTDSLLSAASAQYVPPGAYGAGDLDRHGSWRVVPEYGSVWVPAGVPVGWAPYSTGRWIWDPYFEWTWVDDAPWGWAPYHYGRWVLVGGYWAWAPGPIVERPYYAPALVAFLDPAIVTVSRPVSWVALGWGEPCVPWWRQSRYAGRPWWGGWGGPRVVNGHRNVDVHRAVVAVPAERFGHGAVGASRLTSVQVAGLRPVRGPLGIRPTPGSLVPATGHAVKPKVSGRRSVVAIRPPHDVTPRLRAEGLVTPAPASGAAPRTKLVAMPDRERRLPAGERREPVPIRKPSEAGPDPRQPATKPERSLPRPPDSPARAERAIETRPRDGRRERAEQGQRRVEPQPPARPPLASTSPPTPPGAAAAGPVPRVERGDGTRRPAVGQDAPARLRSAGPLQAPLELERPGAPRAVRHQPAEMRDPARPSIQAPREDRRPAASPGPGRPDRPGSQRVERRRSAGRIAPPASSAPEDGSSVLREGHGRKRDGEPAERRATHKAR
jgi:hypothetical protein